MLLYTLYYIFIYRSYFLHPTLPQLQLFFLHPTLHSDMSSSSMLGPTFERIRDQHVMDMLAHQHAGTTWVQEDNAKARQQNSRLTKQSDESDEEEWTREDRGNSCRVCHRGFYEWRWGPEYVACGECVRAKGLAKGVDKDKDNIGDKKGNIGDKKGRDIDKIDKKGQGETTYASYRAGQLGKGNNKGRNKGKGKGQRDNRSPVPLPPLPPPPRFSRWSG